MDEPEPIPTTLSAVRRRVGEVARRHGLEEENFAFVPSRRSDGSLRFEISLHLGDEEPTADQDDEFRAVIDGASEAEAKMKSPEDIERLNELRKKLDDPRDGKSDGGFL